MIIPFYGRKSGAYKIGEIIERDSEINPMFAPNVRKLEDSSINTAQEAEKPKRGRKPKDSVEDREAEEVTTESDE